MARSIWKGSVSFGMVNIPVRLNLATDAKAKVSFNQFCPVHQSRINNKKWCAKGEHETSQRELVKVYEYQKDSYVVMDEDDLEKLPLKSSKNIEIAGFVGEDDIPGPLYYQSAYYLEPDKEAAAKSYALLTKTLAKTKRIAVAKFALRERERLVSLRALDGVLLLNTLHWPDEIRSTEDLDIPDVPVSAKEVAMAESLVEAMATTFEPGEFKDRYKEAVEEIVEAKVKGGTDIVEAPEAEPATAVIDLMSVLKASVERAQRSEKGTRPAGRSTTKAARRKAS